MSDPTPTRIEQAATPAFEVLCRDGATQARCGELRMLHGPVRTPIFMPVATVGTVKGLTPAQVREDVRAQIILSNTYHLSLRPGIDLVRRMGGLHHFMGWDGPILTDSGGFQVFSLSKIRKVTDDGVEFRSHLDGRKLLFTPESTVQAQVDLGVDVAMVLDECVAGDATRRQAEEAADRSLAWAERCRQVPLGDGRLLFGIVQGGVFPDLRTRNAESLVSLDFPGYAVGGLSVGEERGLMLELAAHSVASLPTERPRYLMGVGLPEDLIRFVGMGYDMFDCVLPTRNGRNGMLFTSRGKLNLRLARWAEVDAPADPDCGCYTCRSFSLAYLRHLMLSHEMLGPQLASLHNLHFYLHLMQEMRQAIEAGTFADWSARCIAEIEQGVH